MSGFPSGNAYPPAGRGQAPAPGTGYAPYAGPQEAPYTSSPPRPYGGAAYFPPPLSSQPQPQQQHQFQPQHLAHSTVHTGLYHNANPVHQTPGTYASYSPATAAAVPPTMYPPQPEAYAGYPARASPSSPAGASYQGAAIGPSSHTAAPTLPAGPGMVNRGPHPRREPAAAAAVAPEHARPQRQGAEGVVGPLNTDGLAARDGPSHPSHTRQPVPTAAREDLLTGAPLTADDEDAKMKAMVDAASRAKVAGGGAASPADRRGGKGLQFAVGAPRYTMRIALLFAAGLFGMIPLMSTYALTVLLCGVVSVYIADYLGNVRATVTALLCTAVAFSGTLLLSNLHAALTSFGPALMVLDLSCVLGMATAACVLHFHWLQETRPHIVSMLERCVMSVTPILALPSLLTTSIALLGSRYGPFGFLSAMCVLHYFFYGPLKSSFLVAAVNKEELQYYLKATPKVRQDKRKGKVGKKDGVALADGVEDERRLADDLPAALGDAEGEDGSTVALAYQQLNDRSHAAVFTLLLMTLPIVLYNFLQTNWEDHVLSNLINSLGLFCGAFTYLCLSPKRSLWFLAPPPEAVLKASETGGTNPNAMNPETVALLLAYDPLGLQYVIEQLRTRALVGVGVLGVHWAAYRLTNSRYSFLFDGVPYPFNVVCLLVALMVAAFLGIQIFILMAADEAGEDISRGTHVARRATVVFGSILVVVLFCALAGTPGIFYFLGILSVTSLNVFLVDRTNTGPMISFIVFSSMLLLWWMYRSFSFIVVDLRVLNGTGKVSSAAVGVSVLWSYVLGCLVFLFSFSKSKMLIVVFVFLHAIELTFVEEVLVAQKDEGAYPAVLVLFTSGVGALVGYRFYQNEVLGIQGAAFVASCYLAKILTLLVETTGAYYSGEMERQSPDLAKALLASEISSSWWAGLVACYVALLFEIERRKRLAAREAVRLPYAYLFTALVITLCTIRNVQRAVYEFFTQSYVAADELPHIALGTACTTFALLTGPFFARQAKRYPHLAKYATLGKLSAVLGVLLLAVQPTRVAESSVSTLDYELAGADKGRYAGAVGLLMLLGTRVVPLGRCPLAVRVGYWLTAAVLLAFSITAQLLPAPTLPLFACMFGFVFLMLLLVDLAHYRDLKSMEGWIVYGLSFFVMISSFVMIGRVDLIKAAHGNVALVWEMHEQGRIQLLSIIAVVNMFVAILLRCRFAGQPLLPRCVPMTASIASQIGVMGNYATLFSVCTLSVLNFWVNESEPVVYVCLSLFLLLLVDDETLFFDLHLRHYRYFPCVVFALGTLWLCLFYHGWVLGATRGTAFRLYAAIRNAAYGLPLVPAQASLLLDLYDVDGPRAAPGGGKASRVQRTDKRVVATVIMSAIVLIFTSSPTLTWMAMVCVYGQCARVFGHTILAGTGPRRNVA